MIKYITKPLYAIFGTANERLIKAYRKRVDIVNELEPEYDALTDEQLKTRAGEFKDRIKKGESTASLMPHIMALARQVMDRAVGIRNVFNPEFKFDPSQLPADARTAFDQVVADMATLQPLPELGCAEPVPAWQQVKVPNIIYTAVRKLHPISRPPFRARPFDVQLIGGMVLGEGKIAEMRTGEGKTIVAPLACFVACLEALQCYVVTVNDYLVQRDRDWVFPFYYHTGFHVGAIHPFHMQSQEGKADAYRCNVVYGTNAEFGFDYLRDNMKTTTDEQVQKHRDFCIIDEVDSILIDEARTPLIISGPAHEDAPRYALADDVARHLVTKQRNWDLANEKVQQAIMRIKGYEGDIRNARDKDKAAQMKADMKALIEKLPQLEDERDKHTRYYEVEMERKSSHLTHEGIAEAQKRAQIGSFYVGNNMDFPHLLENALRSHAVYTRDKDYVVHEGEVIIVDEFTGRPMIGRQWSDGLHQAVEAKEAVKIKQETQTLATVTIQNYFKLFKRLAGMTGTALTEASEFNDIYRLEVVAIPTNKPVIRTDKPDLVYVSKKDKWNAILDEIKRFQDIGRPVLVGTTNVENSEMLSQMLRNKYAIKHQVLNAKQTFKENEKEAHLIDGAGKLGAVMIATNMAGRGTDIKLQPVVREELIRHWQLRDIAPRDATPELPDEQIINLVYRHLAVKDLGLKPKDVEQLSDEQVQLKLLQKWVEHEQWVETAKAEKMTADECRKMLDEVFGFMFHRLKVYKHVEEMGGLHIVGTERHESRRIDNQLRGRAGRQGDQGSSRFFVALEDDLMKQFAGPKILAILSHLGMKEGDVIESPMVSSRIEGAQKKVEERNYQIRKQLLDYDEVMEHQRNYFYGLRQDVLEARNIDTVIFDYIEDAVADAVNLYMDRDYVPTQIAEWCRTNLDISIEPYKLREGDLRELQTIVRRTAREDTRATIEITIGEYMSNDLLPEEWDIGNLVEWAKTKFNVELKPSDVRQMTIPQVTKLLTEKALELVEAKDLEGLGKFMDHQYGLKALAEWAEKQFAIKLDLQALASSDNNGAAKLILDEARKSYRHREIAYPIEFTLDLTFQAAQQNSAWAAQNLATWGNRRFEMGWTPETVMTMSGGQLREKLVEAAEPWIHGNKIDAVISKALVEHKTPEALAAFTQERFGLAAKPEEFEKEETREKTLREKAKKMLRSELNMLEQFVLQQILDVAWKDHLYGMQQLKDAVGLRGYAEKDPRIEYKREGANLFAAMQRHVRDRVTELIFRAQLRGQVEARSVYNVQSAVHPDATAVAAEQKKLEAQAAAQAAGEAPEEPQSRKARRAAGKEEEDEGGDDDKRPKFKERKRR